MPLLATVAGVALISSPAAARPVAPDGSRGGFAVSPEVSPGGAAKPGHIARQHRLAPIDQAGIQSTSSATAAATVSGIPSKGSIVFSWNNNVWLTSPDGATQRPLTTNGTANTPYRFPTQSDDGSVIIAVQFRLDQAGGFPRGYLYEMNRQGTLLRPPFAPVQYQTELGGSCSPPVLTAPRGVQPAVSPDGTKVVVDVWADDFHFGCGGTQEAVAYVMNLDGSGMSAFITPQSSSSSALDFIEPSWVTRTRLLLYHDLENGIYYYDLGAATATPWAFSSGFNDNAYTTPSLRAGELVTGGSVDTTTSLIRVWVTNGGPPALPTARCGLTDPAAAFLQSPKTVLAPDGKSLAAYQQENSSGVSGIYISAVGNIAAGGNCSGFNPQLLVAGGLDPYWGPAAVNPPTISAVTPSAGSTAGGTAITVTGTNFTAPATVSLGGVAATNVVVVSATKITATTAAHAAATVDVVVSTGGGPSAKSAADRYTYGPPVVTTLSPSSGPSAGGTVVTVTGTGFAAGATVHFGTQAATAVTILSPTQLHATAPAAPASTTVEVTVTTPAGTSATSTADHYRYI